ncbi:MAG: Non-motile and phage-resistance protein [Parcubacteria group bacterium ADurb.Bin216]|nr:MAG: Non-motile and phage-resistance protein [Parcubacteria group bacterium ADurb.Bin216]
MESIPFVIYLLVPSSLIIMGVGIYTHIKARNKESLIFLFLTIAQSLFSIGNFFLWDSCGIDKDVIFWDRLLYIPGIMMPPLIYHFTLEFCNRKTDKDKLSLGISYALACVLIMISQQNYFVNDVFNYNWGCHTVAQTGHHFFAIYVFYYVIKSIVYLYHFWKGESNDSSRKSQTFFVFLAFLAYSFLALVIIVAYKIPIYPFFYLSLPLFALLMTYAIIEKNVFVSIFAIDVLMVAILIMVSTFLLFPEDTLINADFSGRLFFFVLILAASFFLIKKNHEEISRKDEIERVSRLKSEFISISSHQLRTPLGAIRGYSSMMLEGDYGKINKKMHEPLTYINDASVRMIKLVNSLLDVSRLERGKLEFKLSQNVSVNKIIKECIDDVTLNAKAKGIYIKFKEDDSIPVIRADEDKIKQSIHNLINNAVLYTQKGGITITTKKKRAKTIFIQIRDTGIGIAKDDLEKIFKSFSRGNGASQIYTQGTGLGLFVAKNFIEMHNGKLRVSSEGEGKGSLFCIELPVKSFIEEKQDFNLTFEKDNG